MGCEAPTRAALGAAGHFEYAVVTVAIEIGRFQLLKALAEGGMGVVWLALDRRSGTRVAIKIITAQPAFSTKGRQAFGAEVRAAASLDHPGIVEVIDYGTVPEAAAEASQGALSTGSPYLAMELAAGSLRQHRVGRLDFDAIQTILLEVLDALAHAHARGVVHRDLKPGNILWVPHDGSIRFKLADFGIAWMNDRRKDDDDIQGSPHYMAPEQVLGHWRDFGPWTDLYALGCCAWWLFTGNAPFYGSQSPLAAHLNARPPAFLPAIEVPPGLADWLAVLLAKEPCQRFARAADAAWALEQVVDGSWPGGLDGVTQNNRTLDDIFEERVEVTPTNGTPPSLSHWDLPPIQASWRRQTRIERPERTPFGEGLFGIRRVPVIGRSKERDRLWAALLRTIELHSTQAVALVGPAGMGTSRLADWLCERADESGAATVLRAVHSERGGPADGIGPMLARHYRCTDLSRREVQSRLADPAHQLGAESLTLAEVIHPIEEDDGGPTVRFQHARERYLTVARVLEVLADRRPVILWIDDAQWGLDALGLWEYLLGHSHGPVLIVATVTKDRSTARAPRAQLAGSWSCPMWSASRCRRYKRSRS